MSNKSCFYCRKGSGDLRPYGPQGSWVHYECVKETPERERAAAKEYAAQLNRAARRSGIVLLTPQGPIPMIVSHSKRAGE